MKILKLSLLILSSVMAAQGIVCWICNNQPGQEACRANGRLEKCQQNQHACQNEETSGSDGNYYVTKRCQDTCDYNVQNTDQESSNCNSKNSNSICRCCCTSDQCNEASVACSPPAHCNQLKVGESVECSNGNLLGSTCNITCDSLLILRGSSSVTCLGDTNGDGVGEWSDNPHCEERRPIICPPIVPIKNATVSCSFYSVRDSICTYECLPLYKLVGEKRSVCIKPETNYQNGVGVWNAEPPTCKPLQCNPDHLSAPLHGSSQCTKSNFALSVCTHSCEKGYFLDGQTSSTCGIDEKWSSPQPVCKLIQCSPMSTPYDGVVNCTNSNLPGSVCSFTCENEYLQMKGSKSTECIDDKNGDAEALWSNDLPTCVEAMPILCTPQTYFLNGQARCTAYFLKGSVCQFSCNSHYKLDGSGMSVCNEGKWMPPAPTCTRCSDTEAC